MENPTELGNQENSSIIGLCLYFVKKLESYTDKQRETVKQVLPHKIPIISMLLDKDDIIRDI